MDSSAHSSKARAAAVAIVTALHRAGHVAYLAGGCVRDELLGRQPKDYDVATSAHPEAVKALFRRSRFVGEAFGVVLVRTGHMAIEVATFRRESGYADGRRPTEVHFTDAQEDAQRRDFTVNGLFEDPLAEGNSGAEASVVATRRGGRIIDYVGGIEDLRGRVIRAIGDPDARFGEDYLRLLRAVRFAAVLGFALEPRTAAAIATQPKLGKISRERIGQELRRMFDVTALSVSHVTSAVAGSLRDPGLALPSGGPAAAARMIQDLHLDAPILHEDHAQVPLPTLRALTAPPWGEQATFAAVLAAWALDRHLIATLPATPDTGNNSVLAAALDQWLAKGGPALLRRWRKALCLSNDERDALAEMIEDLESALRWPALTRAGRKRLLAGAHWPQVRAVLGALSLQPVAVAMAEQIDQQSAELLAEGVAPPAFLTGEDLIRIGLHPGPAFGRLLDEAYELQLEGRLTDRDQALLWLRQQPG